jgi:CheY-like chemotaxis protein
MKKMSIFVHSPNPATAAFLQVVNLTEFQLEKTESQASADIVFVTELRELRGIYNSTQIFLVMLPGSDLDRSPKQPENVCLVDAFKIFDPTRGIAQLVALCEARGKLQAKPAVKAAAAKPSNLAHFAKRYAVLVIDDKEENLERARVCLEGHDVVTVNRLQVAVQEMDARKFDAVLSDMEMLPDKLYPSLNLDQYGVTDTVPYGFAAIIEATERGLPIAIVTDGNHHASWVSAMFDHKKGMTANGQKVLFFNNIGKGWDVALKALMEPET